MLTDESLQRYQKIKQAIETWLQEKNLPYLAPPPLPSELYADASHPLSEGYKILALQIFEVLPWKR
jgi:hypothetical protein